MITLVMTKARSYECNVLAYLGHLTVLNKSYTILRLIGTLEFCQLQNMETLVQYSFAELHNIETHRYSTVLPVTQYGDALVQYSFSSYTIWRLIGRVQSYQLHNITTHWYSTDLSITKYGDALVWYSFTSYTILRFIGTVQFCQLHNMETHW